MGKAVKPLLDFAAIASIFSGFTLVAAISYQIPTFVFFRIPLSLLEVPTPEVALIALLVAVCGLFLWPFAMHPSRGSSALRLATAWFSLILVITAIMYGAGAESTWDLYIMMVYALGAILIFYLRSMPCVRMRRKRFLVRIRRAYFLKTTTNKRETLDAAKYKLIQKRRRVDRRRKTVVSIIVRRAGLAPFYLFFLATIVVTLSYGFGLVHVKNVIVVPEIQGTHEVVIVEYADRILLTCVDHDGYYGNGYEVVGGKDADRIAVEPVMVKRLRKGFKCKFSLPESGEKADSSSGSVRGKLNSRTRP